MNDADVKIEAASILIVDDTPDNLHLLTKVLKSHGYRPRPVPSGQLAIQAAENEPPDLILLDISMPEMDGFEVCERLKSDESLREIPIIFISALTETLDKVRAFKVGGVDYVTKPFQIDEVLARIKTHLDLRQSKRLLQDSLNNLRELESLRDSLVHMIVHDMRTPLMGVLNHLELLKTLGAETLTGKGVRWVDRAMISIETIIEMASSMLDVSKAESGQLKLDLATIDLASLARSVVFRMEPLRGDRRVEVIVAKEPAMVVADTGLVTRVMQNLIGNAYKYTPPEGKIIISVEQSDSRLRVEVQDNGSGIPEKLQDKIFEKFFRVEGQISNLPYSSGIGLTFCRYAVLAHDGLIGVESKPGHGSTFWFELPRQATAAK